MKKPTQLTRAKGMRSEGALYESRLERCDDDGANSRAALTERVGASQAKRDWSKVIYRAFSGEVRFVVEKHGTPVAGIVSAEDIERLAALDARWAEGHEILKRFGRAFRDQTAEEIEEAVAQAVAEVRAENRRGAERQPVPE